MRNGALASSNFIAATLCQRDFMTLRRFALWVVICSPLAELFSYISVINIGQEHIRIPDIYYLVCVGAALLVAVFSRFSVAVYWQFLLFSLLLVIQIAGILLVRNYSTDWSDSLRFLQTLSWGLISLSVFRTESELKRYARVIVVTATVVAVSSMVIWFKEPTLQRIAGYYSYAGSKGLGHQASYNEWGATFSFAIVLAFLSLGHSRRTLIMIGMALICVVGLIMTQSRSALLALCVSVLVYMFVNGKWRLASVGASRGNTRNIIIVVLGIAVGAIAASYFAINRYASSFVGSTNAYQSMTERFSLWARGVDVWLSSVANIFLGYGGGVFGKYIDSPTTDSFYLDHVLISGLLGLIIIVTYLAHPVIHVHKRDVTRFVKLSVYLTFTIAVVVSLTGNVLVDPTFGGFIFSWLGASFAVANKTPSELRRRSRGMPSFSNRWQV